MMAQYNIRLPFGLVVASTIARLLFWLLFRRFRRKWRIVTLRQNMAKATTTSQKECPMLALPEVVQRPLVLSSRISTFSLNLTKYWTIHVSSDAKEDNAAITFQAIIPGKWHTGSEGVEAYLGVACLGMPTVAAWLVEVTNVGAEITGGLAISDNSTHMDCDTFLIVDTI